MSHSTESAPQLLTTPIVLPRNLRGHVKYVAGLDEEAGVVYSIGIRFVLPTAGAQHLLDRLRAQRYREYKKPVVGTLCPSLATGALCPEGAACAKIHAEPEGYLHRRMRERPSRRETTSPTQDSNSGSAPTNVIAASPPQAPTSPTSLLGNRSPCPPTVPLLPRPPFPDHGPSPAALQPRRPPPCDFWGRAVREWDDAMSAEAASDGASEPRTPPSGPCDAAAAPCAEGGSAVIVPGCHPHVSYSALCGPGAALWPHPSAVPLHQRVPLRPEQRYHGHTAHNPYVWATEETVFA